MRSSGNEGCGIVFQRHQVIARGQRCLAGSTGQRCLPLVLLWPVSEAASRMEMRMSAIKCYVVYLFDFFKGLKDAPLMLPSSTRRWLPVVQCYENISSLPLGYLRVGDTCSTPTISRAPPSLMLQMPRQSIPHLTLDSEVRKKKTNSLKVFDIMRR